MSQRRREQGGQGDTLQTMYYCCEINMLKEILMPAVRGFLSEHIVDQPRIARKPADHFLSISGKKERAEKRLTHRALKGRRASC